MLVILADDITDDLLSQSYDQATLTCSLSSRPTNDQDEPVASNSKPQPQSACDNHGAQQSFAACLQENEEPG